MGERYTVYSSLLWKAFKEYSRDRSPESFIDFTTKHPPKDIIPKYWVDNWDTLKDLYLENAHLDYIYRYRKSAHYFVSPGVADFCHGAVKEISSDYLKTIQVNALFFHFPVNERNRSIAIQKCFSEYGDSLLISDGHSTIAMPVNNPQFGIGNDEQTKILKTIMGLTLYMDAFPDAVKELSDPSCIDSHKLYRGRKIYVGAVDHVRTEESRKMSPHWRRGHFRTLQSERFTKKRWQVIYIEGLFVKGKAYVVDSDAPPVEKAS